MYDIVLFDLDGTLTDPGEGITNSVAYALNKFGIKVEDKTELYNFIGPPLIDSFPVLSCTAFTNKYLVPVSVLPIFIVAVLTSVLFAVLIV